MAAPEKLCDDTIRDRTAAGLVLTAAGFCETFVQIEHHFVHELLNFAVVRPSHEKGPLVSKVVFLLRNRLVAEFQLHFHIFHVL